MSATDEVPAGELEARRERLKDLKAKAASKGLHPSRPTSAASPAAPAGSDAQGGKAPFGGDRSKYYASLLLNTLRARPENEKDPKMVPGTVFTEFGLGKLMEKLKERSELMGSQGKTVIKRFYDFLTAPADAGQQVAMGVNLEHLERFVNFILKMETAGWEGVKKDFMTGSGKELLEAFSKPRIEVIESVVNDLKEKVAALTAQVAALKGKV